MSAEEQKTILLVEDEAIIAMAEKITLEKFGYRVLAVHHGEDAVTTVASTPGIDLILMDIDLGKGMDGTEAAALILADHDLPVVFLSSHMEPEVVARTEKITSYGYVVKNSSSTVLDASIKMAFKLFAAKTQEQKKEEALRESEASYRVLFSGASDGILVADSQTKRFRFANPAICRMMGYTEEEFLRLSVADIHPPESLDHVLAEFDALTRGEIRTSPDLPCLRKDGTIFYADISHNTMVLAGQEYHAGFFHDITARKQAEEAVFQSKKDWEDCFDSITDMITIHDNDYNIVRANKAGKELLKLPALEKHLTFKCFSFYHGTDAPPVGCPSCDCLKSSRPGVFEMFEPHLDRHLEIRALPRFDSNGHQAGLIHIVRDITARQQAEKVLRESEQWNKLILSTILSGVLVIEVATRKIVEANDMALKLIGLPKEQVVGSVCHQFVCPADRKNCPILDLGKEVDFSEKILLTADGKRMDIIKTVVPVQMDGRNYLIESFVDISEHKRVESQNKTALESLQESDERFHSFFDNSNAGIYRTAPDGSIHLANPALIRMLGYSSFAELAEKDLNKSGFEPSYPRAQFVAKIEKDGEVKGLESVWKRKDGGTIIVRESARAIRDARGKTLFYDGIVEDVSEIKHSEKLTATLYGISQAMLTSGDLDELYPRIHGLIAGIVPADNFFIALLTDDGRTLAFPYYRDEKDNDDKIFIKTDDPLSLTVEVLRTKKPLLLNEAQLQERYASGRNRVWGTAPKCWLGVPLRIRDRAIGVMVIQDYHDDSAYSPGDVMLLESTAGQIAIAIDRKRAEKALRESMESFKSYFNMGTVGMCVSSLDKGWIEVNDCLCRMLGYARKELLRLTWDEMTHPDDLNVDLNLFNQVLAGERDSYELEKRFIRKDGQVMHTLLYVTCQRHPEGTVHLFLASLVDISQRKRAEEEIKRQLAEKEVLLREIHHRIKNNIASISGLLSLRLRSIVNPEAAAALQDAIGRVDSMGLLYEKLMLSEAHKDVSVKIYAESLIDMVVAQFQGDTRIALDKRIDDFPLDPKQLFPLGIIINELLTNIMKYAFSGRDRGSIQFSLVRAGGRVTLTLQDDGHGLPPGFDAERSEGFGLMLVKMLSRQLAGCFSIENRAGTRCVVQFKA